MDATFNYVFLRTLLQSLSHPVYISRKLIVGKFIPVGIHNQHISPHIQTAAAVKSYVFAFAGPPLATLLLLLNTWLAVLTIS